MSRDNVTRWQFIGEALCAAGTCMCPSALAANPQNPGAPFDKKATKPKSYVLINVNAVCCGTCQHWRGERMVVEHGNRVKCQSTAESACFRGAGFKYAPTSPAASHGCVAGKQYKRWIDLPQGKAV